MSTRTRLASAVTIAILSIPIMTTAGIGTAAAQPIVFAQATGQPVGTIPPELEPAVAQAIGNINAAEAGGEQEIGPLVVIAARAIVAAARAAGPRVYSALVAAVRAGYSSFNAWCNANAAVCAIPVGVASAALYDALKDILK